MCASGLPSKMVLDLLPCVDVGVSTPESMARLIAERDRINLQIGGLMTTREHLDAIIDAAGASSAATRRAVEEDGCPTRAGTGDGRW